MALPDTSTTRGSTIWSKVGSDGQYWPPAWDSEIPVYLPDRSVTWASAVMGGTKRRPPSPATTPARSIERHALGGRWLRSLSSSPARRVAGRCDHIRPSPVDDDVGFVPRPRVTCTP